jgi:arsenate reductase (thioredoxin)
MAQALLERVADCSHEARSAGTRPADRVNPVVVEAMREVGADLSARKPALLTDELGRWADLVVTMGCGDECPYLPDKRYLDWDLQDPKDAPLPEVRRIRDDIETRVSALLDELG